MVVKIGEDDILKFLLNTCEKSFIIQTEDSKTKKNVDPLEVPEFIKSEV